MPENSEILVGLSVPKMIKPGRPRGSGRNLNDLRKLAKLSESDSAACLYGLTYKRMRSVVVSAQNEGVKIKVRKLDDRPRRESRFGIWIVKTQQPTIGECS